MDRNEDAPFMRGFSSPLTEGYEGAFMELRHEFQPSSNPDDVWAAGDLYEPYVGRWSRLIAREFIPRLGVLPGSSWLDVGCGTGALSQTILDCSAPGAVLGIDASEGFLASARRRVTDPQLVEFRRGDAQSLPV